MRTALGPLHCNSWQLFTRRAMSASVEALTAAPAEAVEAVPEALQQRTVSDAQWTATHRLPSTGAQTTFASNTTGFNKPFVLPARLDRGVDILHDPVFNKVRCPRASVAHYCPLSVDLWHSLLPPPHPRAPASRWPSVTGWASAAWCRPARCSCKTRRRRHGRGACWAA